MKITKLITAALAATALTLTGCAINQNVRPVTTAQIQMLCIKKNPAVMMTEFVTELQTQVEAKAIKTRVFEGATPADCRHRLEYTANWRWDLAMYLVFVDLRVYEGDLMIGQANYDARSGGANMNKFGPTAAKLKGLVDELFARRT